MTMDACFYIQEGVQNLRDAVTSVVVAESSWFLWWRLLTDSIASFIVLIGAITNTDFGAVTDVVYARTVALY